MSNKFRGSAAVLLVAGASLGFVEAAHAETYSQAQYKCNLAATQGGESCSWTALPQVSSTCKVGRGTITNKVWRTYGCPGSPRFVY